MATFEKGERADVEARLAAAEGAGVLTVKPLSIHLGAELSGPDLSRPLPAEHVRAIRDVGAVRCCLDLRAARLANPKASPFQALLVHRVIFFRGAHLDHAQQVAFARTLGTPTIGHSVFGYEEGHPEVYSIAKFRLANQRSPNAATAPGLATPMKKPWSGYHTCPNPPRPSPPRPPKTAALVPCVRDVTAAVNPPWCSVLRATDVPPFGGDTCWTSLNAAYEGLSEEMQRFVGSLRGVHSCPPPPIPPAPADSI